MLQLCSEHECCVDVRTQFCLCLYRNSIPLHWFLIYAQNSPPKFSMPNQWALGLVPNNLPRLRWIEELALALHHINSYVLTIGPKHISEAHKVTGILGHAIAFDQDPSVLHNMLRPGVFPVPPSHLNAIVSVFFVGPRSQIGEVVKRSKVLECRRDVLAAWCEFLKENNPYWKNLDIDSSALQQYPTDGPIPEIISAATVVEDRDESRQLMHDMVSAISDYTGHAPVQEPDVSGNSDNALSGCTELSAAKQHATNTSTSGNSEGSSSSDSSCDDSGDSGSDTSSRSGDNAEASTCSGSESEENDFIDPNCQVTTS